MFLLISIPVAFCFSKPSALNFVFPFFIQLPIIPIVFEVLFFFKAVTHRCSVCSYSFEPFLAVIFFLKHDDVPGLAEPLHFAIFAFALDLYAVIHHTVGNAGAAVNTQVLHDAHFARTPVQRVSRAGFDAEFALTADACELVNLDFAFLEELFDACGFKQFLAPLPPFRFFINLCTGFLIHQLVGRRRFRRHIGFTVKLGCFKNRLYEL